MTNYNTDTLGGGKNRKNELNLYTLPSNTEALDQDTLDMDIRRQIHILDFEPITASILLSRTTVAFNANGDTTLYTVPSNKRAILDFAVVVAGADAGATTTLAIGSDGAETNFVPANTLSNLDIINDVVIVRPIPSTTPLKGKVYASGTVLQAQIGTQSGGTGNIVYLFGFLI